jgi:hypothetical protein
MLEALLVVKLAAMDKERKDLLVLQSSQKSKPRGS